MTAQARATISDLAFTGRYRGAFQFALAARAPAGGRLPAPSEGVQVEDLDGNRFYDLTGSYGVNVLGYDTYKACMHEAPRPLKR